MVTATGLYRLSVTYLRRYWFGMAWMATSCLVFCWEFSFYRTAPQFYYLRQMLGTGVCFSRGTAAVINMCLLVLVVPVCRGLLSLIVGATGGNSCFLLAPFIHYPKTTHLLVAYVLVASAAVHTVSHVFNIVNFSLCFSDDFPEINLAAFPGQNPFILLLTTVSGLTGILMVAVLMALVFTSLRCTRRYNFELFYYTHCLSAVFLLFLILHPLKGDLKAVQNIEEHTPGCPICHATDVSTSHENESSLKFLEQRKLSDERFSMISLQAEKQRKLETNSYVTPGHMEGGSTSNEKINNNKTGDIDSYQCNYTPVFVSVTSKTWMWASGSIALLLIELLIRWFRRRKPLDGFQVIFHLQDVIEVQAKKTGFYCKPGQYILLCCPEVSPFQWHPFTVAKCPTDAGGTFTLFVHVRGNWSGKLASFLQEQEKCEFCFSSIAGNYQHRKATDTLSCCNHVSLPFAVKVNHSSCNFKATPSLSNYWDSAVTHSTEVPVICGSTLPLQCWRQGSEKLLTSCNYSSAVYGSEGEHSSNASVSFYVCKDKRVPSKQTFVNGCKFVHTYGSSERLDNINRSVNNKFKNDRVISGKEIQNSINVEKDSHNELQRLHTETPLQRVTRRNRTEDVLHKMPVSLYVDGPFCSPNEIMRKYPIIICTLGGIGVTSVSATISSLLNTTEYYASRLHIVWAVRDVRYIHLVSSVLHNLVELLWNLRHEDRMELCLHLTRSNANDATSCLQRMFPSVAARVFQGRPDWNEYFERWQQQYRRTNVGVFSCGPRHFCEAVRHKTLETIARGCNFTYHHESYS